MHLIIKYYHHHHHHHHHDRPYTSKCVCTYAAACKRREKEEEKKKIELIFRVYCICTQNRFITSGNDQSIAEVQSQYYYKISRCFYLNRFFSLSFFWQNTNSYSDMHKNINIIYLFLYTISLSIIIIILVNTSRTDWLFRMEYLGI
jgi:hypothetical protein